MSRNPDLNRLNRIYVAADAGTITLPDDVTDARRVLNALATPYEILEVGDLCGEITAAAEAGQPRPTVDLIAPRIAQIDATRQLEDARRDAHERAGYRLVARTQEAADQIITEHLRPLHDRLVNDIAKAFATIGANTFDPVEMLSAPPKVREARIALDGLIAEYLNVLSLHTTIREHSPSQLDVSGLFTFARNGHTLWPKRSGAFAQPQPWPSDPLDRMRWMIDNGAQLWCPTGTDRDKAWAASFPDSPRLKGQHATAQGWEQARGPRAMAGNYKASL